MADMAPLLNAKETYSCMYKIFVATCMKPLYFFIIFESCTWDGMDTTTCCIFVLIRHIKVVNMTMLAPNKHVAAKFSMN